MKKLTFIGIPLSLLLGLVLSTVGLTTRAMAEDFIVTSNDEAELRLFINKAEVLYTLSGGVTASTITFAPNVTGTITLTMGELVIKSNLTIIGPGANLLTISGNNASRVFYITPVTTSIPLNNTVTLEGLTIAGGNGGGATNTGNGGGIYNESTLIINNCIVTGNAVAGFSGSGGGIFNTPSGTLTIINSAVSGNSAINAGGILNSGPLTITDSAVSNNSVTVNGGGIGSAGVISLTVTNSIVSGNSAGGYGGGFTFNGSVTLRLINSTVSGNSAGANGGGFIGEGKVEATNSTITGNRADSNGDAFGAGGGFYSVGRKLNNTIVAGNFRGAGSTPDDINGTISTANTANNSLIGDAATSGGIANGVNGNKVGFAVSAVLDTTLANNGGPTLTHALVPGSPALNAGSNALALDASSNALTTDQRGTGFPRISGGTVDIGAFEAQIVLPSLSINDVSASEGNAGTKTFNFTVSLSSPAPVAVTFNIATQDDSATTANNDYVPQSLTSQTIPTGNSTYMFEVTVNGDATVESGEMFFVNVTNVTGASIADGQGMGTITNDDSAGVTIVQSGGSTAVTEGGATDMYTIALNTQPSEDVTIWFDTGSQLQAISSRIFTPANWAVAQTITVAAVDDNVVEGAHTGTISHTATSGDTNYNGIAIASVTVNITDNDSATGFNFIGFFQPVDNSPTINVVAAGSAIPVKFSLGGYQGMAIFASGSPYSQVTVCGTSNPTDVIEETVTAGASSLSYDATTDQYKYVWKTDKAWKGTCRKLMLRFSDGTTREARFQFK